MDEPSVEKCSEPVCVPPRKVDSFQMKREDLLDFNEAVQHPGRRLTFDVETELKQEEDLDLLEPVSGEIEGVSTGNLLLIKAQFQTTCVVECARCGAPLNVPLKYEMDDQFTVEGVPSGYASDGYAKVVTDEPYPLFHHNALMRDTYVRQGLLVNVPVQPLCSFGWDGPCPNAAPREEAEAAEAGHPALQALGQIKIDEADPS